MNTIKIRTTQHVEVEYPLASVGDRIVAHIIDMVVMGVWLIGWAAFFAATGLDGGAILGFLIMVPMVFYHLLCEIFLNGQSVGKKARDLKVVKLSGGAPSLGDYLLRWLFRLVDTAASQGFVALITIAASNKGQRLGDMAAGTCVIRTRAVRKRESAMVTTEEGYQVRFPEVHLLTDQDVAIIRKLLYKAQKYNNYELLEKMALRVREITGIQPGELSEWDFLQTVVKDYHHYTHGEVEL
ncbi:RDD family protein [Pontibacter kalidii]|uniref:RDD family protein n=1 Tax=Pontibacter kalidii TaxID=2592049 RepID=UPI00224EE495|nr:RDD family protein [Pontibacter kalidii]